MKEKNVKISNRDITNYINSREREALLDAFITQDSQKILKDIPRWNDTQRVLSYLDCIVRFSNSEREVFYEHSLLANRGDMVSKCTVCGVTLYATRRSFINIRSQLRIGKDIEEIKENPTILSVYATLRNTQKQYYREEKRDWVDKVKSNLDERNNNGRLNRDEHEILGFVNNILR